MPAEKRKPPLNAARMLSACNAIPNSFVESPTAGEMIMKGMKVDRERKHFEGREKKKGASLNGNWEG
ncbi:hypothetical protein ACFX1S_026684 [Malus domestica]